MKNSILSVILILFVSTVSAQADFVAVNMYNYSSIQAKTFRPMIVSFGSDSIAPRVSFNWFAMTTPDFTEGLVGFGTQLSSRWSGNAVVGIENHPGLLRGQVNLIRATQKSFLLVSGEYGVSGYWYMSLFHTPITKNIRAGAFVRRFEGIGPCAELAFGKCKAWVAPVLYNHETHVFGTEFGLRINL